MATILIVDDDAQVSAAIGAFFERGGHQVLRASNGEDAIDVFMRARPDLVMLDMRLPDVDGFEVLARMSGEDAVIIMITGHGDIGVAVRAMREGAENFLTKPIDLDHLAIAAERALEKARLRQLQRYLRERRGGVLASHVLGSSPGMRELAHQVELLAASGKTTVLLVGESGTGKGRTAEAIHMSSPRADRAFVEASCVGRHAESLESELFGGPRGAGTGAHPPSLLELADGGTLFLDEITALTLETQGRLLAMLDGRGPTGIAHDVRVIAATSRDLVGEVNAGRFREDLYYRISVMPVHLPPLRARAREDVVELVGRLLDELRPQLPSAPAELSDAALDQLLHYSWPGNVRELRNAIERAMILAAGGRRVSPEHLPPEVRRATAAGRARHVPRALEEVERAHIERTLRAHNENRTRAARELGISRATLINKIKIYGLETNPPSRRAAPRSHTPSH
ncbi:MAG: sigma-54 dependent transcriptional regulator [Gemmatimonadaceae bacterium]